MQGTQQIIHGSVTGRGYQHPVTDLEKYVVNTAVDTNLYSMVQICYTGQ